MGRHCDLSLLTWIVRILGKDFGPCLVGGRKNIWPNCPWGRNAKTNWLAPPFLLSLSLSLSLSYLLVLYGNLRQRPGGMVNWAKLKVDLQPRCNKWGRNYFGWLTRAKNTSVLGMQIELGNLAGEGEGGRGLRGGRVEKLASNTCTWSFGQLHAKHLLKLKPRCIFIL